MQSLVKPFNRRTGAKTAVVLLTITFIIIAFASMTTSAPEVTYGDVNQDGSIDVRDVVLVMQYIIGLRDLTDDQFKAADVNKDGSVNVQDVTMIMRHILKIETIGLAIKSVEEVEINVFINNPADKLYFPSKVLATLEDESTKDINVKWDETSTPPYVKEEVGEYGFEGDLVDIPWGITNPDGIRAKAVVNVIIFDPSFPYPRPDFDRYRLFLMVDPEASGAVSGSGTYQEGETVRVRVTEEAPGFEFVNWTWNGDEISTEMAFDFTMPAENVLLTANFVSDDVTLTFEDIGGVADQLVPGVFNVYISLADAQDNLAGVTTDSIIVLTIPDKDPILLMYNAARNAFFHASVQGYTEDEILGASTSVLDPITAQDLNVTTDLLLPGVYNVSIPYNDAEAILPGITTNSKLILNVVGKDSLELEYNSVRDAFFKPSVQDYTEPEIKSAIVTVQ